MGVENRPFPNTLYQSRDDQDRHTHNGCREVRDAVRVGYPGRVGHVDRRGAAFRRCRSKPTAQWGSNGHRNLQVLIAR